MKKLTMLLAAAAAFAGAALFYAGDNMTAFALCSLAAAIVTDKL
jgi:hypothetical protein